MSYAAPVLWNAVMIATLLGLGGRLEPFPLAEILAWGSVLGSAIQVGIQLPSVIHLANHLRVSLDVTSSNVRLVVRNFGPACLGRGVIQISAYVDALLASFLPTGAVAALSYAQSLAILPISLFGMSVSAAELPAMSSAQGQAREIGAYLQRRLDASLRRVAFLIVPSATALLALGDVIAAAVYQSGRFTYEDAIYVWSILAGSAVGLLASTLGRLYASTYYALRDTRMPLYCAVVRIALSTGVGYVCALHVPPALGIEAKWGVAGLAGASSLAGWVECTLLRCGLNRRLGRTGLPLGLLGRLWGAALAGAAVAWAVKLVLGPQPPIFVAAASLIPYGVVYLGTAYVWGVPEARGAVQQVVRGVRSSPD
jgi:putative peptidoglycan lipid II flippase